MKPAELGQKKLTNQTKGGRDMRERRCCYGRAWWHVRCRFCAAGGGSAVRCGGGMHLIELFVACGGRWGKGAER